MAENNTREAKFTELLTIDLDKSKDFSLLFVVFFCNFDLWF